MSCIFAPINDCRVLVTDELMQAIQPAPSAARQTVDVLVGCVVVGGGGEPGAAGDGGQPGLDDDDHVMAHLRHVLGYQSGLGFKQKLRCQVC